MIMRQMPQQIQRAIFAAILTMLLFGGVVLAASSSANYRIPAMVVEGTGGSGSSANYRTVYNVGQSVIGGSQSTNYRAGLGFWTSGDIIIIKQTVYIPLIMK